MANEKRNKFTCRRELTSFIFDVERAALRELRESETPAHLITTETLQQLVVDKAQQLSKTKESKK